MFAHTQVCVHVSAWLNVLRVAICDTRVTRHTPIRLFAHTNRVSVYLACLNVLRHVLQISTPPARTTRWGEVQAEPELKALGFKP